MINRDKNTGKYQHDWGFMANSEKGDLLQCQEKGCEVWSYGGEKPYFKMNQEQYVAMHESGEIDANEVFGYPSGTVKINK